MILKSQSSGLPLKKKSSVSNNWNNKKDLSFEKKPSLDVPKKKKEGDVSSISNSIKKNNKKKLTFQREAKVPKRKRMLE